MGENNLNDTIVERVGEIRELNNHENQLIDNRFTWMLIIEGLLINAYVTLFRDVAHCPVKFVELIILLLLCGIGIFVTICFFNTFQTARRSMKNLKKRYKELIQKMDMTDSCLYPIAIGLYADDHTLTHKEYMNDNRLDPWISLPKVFIVLWILLILLSILLKILNW